MSWLIVFVILFLICSSYASCPCSGRRGAISTMACCYNSSHVRPSRPQVTTPDTPWTSPSGPEAGCWLSNLQDYVRRYQLPSDGLTIVCKQAGTRAYALSRLLALTLGRRDAEENNRISAIDISLQSNDTVYVDELAMEDYQNVRVVSINGGQNIKFHPRGLVGLPNLKRVDISFINLEQGEFIFLSPLTNTLREFSLTDSFRLRSYPAQLVDMTNLKKLVVANTLVDGVRPDAFQRSAQTLEHIDLSLNKIKLIFADLFRGLTSLKHLNLSTSDRDGVQHLTPGLFDDLTSLKSVSLRHNRLRCLPAGLFQNSNQLRLIDLYNTPIATGDFRDGQFTSTRQLDEHLRREDLACLSDD